MKILVCLALVIVIAEAGARPDNHYDAKYDNFNYQELIDNARLLCAYGKCFCGTAPCTPEGNDMKQYITEGVETACGKCTAKQKPMVAKVMQAMQEKCPQEWQQLYSKYDPDGKHKPELDKFITDNS